MLGEGVRILHFSFFVDICIAYVLDLLLGDPYWFPHPVRFIGWLIAHTEELLRRIFSCYHDSNSTRLFRERIAGVILVVITVGITFIIVFSLLKCAELLSPILFHALNIYFIYSALATRCLGDESLKVYKVLKKRDLDSARRQLAMLVGRQTEYLNEKEIIRGVVETTAENTVDGIISPLVYAVIGSFFALGAPLAYAFKAINTLDSMVGYTNDRYINFGWASAKLDDAANFIPARISGLIIPIAALLCGKSFLKSFRIMLRDRRNHKSPNSAYPEAAFAGALGVRLGGSNIYFGKVVVKPTIGDPDKELELNDIPDAVRLMYLASLTALAFTVLFSFVLSICL